MDVYLSLNGGCQNWLLLSAVFGTPWRNTLMREMDQGWQGIHAASFCNFVLSVQSTMQLLFVYVYLMTGLFRPPFPFPSLPPGKARTNK